MTTRLSIVVAALLTAAPLAALAQHMGHDHADHEAASGAGHEHATGSSAQGARVIELAVTRDGFVPAEIKVTKGEKIRLAVTRRVDKTCATEIVVKDYGISQPLPLGRTVFVELTPKKSGAIRYACGMDMVSGVLVVD